jgi:DNA-binding GntR family transcriptional regulator
MTEPGGEPGRVAPNRTVLREQVKGVLLERILTGRLRPGARLVETRIAQELGTSQAPVREALRDLELLRLVESEPFRGSRVRAFSDEELAEIYPVRATLEELAASEAAARLGGDVAALERELERMRQAAAAGDVTTQMRHDGAFHRLIVEAAGNRILLAVWRSLGVEARMAISLYKSGLDPREVAELHVSLLAAIRDGDRTRAAREARRHVLRLRDGVLRASRASRAGGAAA